ncbi:hypothetical protein H4217_009029 [Coemansia sp. RSA 1939]|nr:hypothetical protein H4217_009029 [Coemansia sp. RSA 1939]
MPTGKNASPKTRSIINDAPKSPIDVRQYAPSNVRSRARTSRSSAADHVRRIASSSLVPRCSECDGHGIPDLSSASELFLLADR